jgi:DNA-binding transcriptional ArsR family regulator
MAASSRSTQNLFDALGHPTRRQILREMDGGPPASPRELTERLDDTLSNVSYHFRVLAEAGVIKLVSTRPVRGSTQHFYGMEIDAEWAKAVLELDERTEANGDPQGEEIA